MISDEPGAPGGERGAPGPASDDLLLAVVGVQLGYFSADEVLISARELAKPGESRSLKDLLLSRGVLDGVCVEALERVTATASAASGSDVQSALERLASGARKWAAQGPLDQSLEERQKLVQEQPHRYRAAPRSGGEAPRELGRSASGRVVSMYDAVLGREVAWKQSLTASPQSDEALMAQARLLAQLEHVAVAPLYELGRDSKGAVYSAQRKVEGQTLAQALASARGPGNRLRLLPALHTVTMCVARAHHRGVTHRRLSCESVHLGRFGEVYLLGWEPPEQSMAPEAVAQAKADDLKALGAMLHQLVTGLPPSAAGAAKGKAAPEELRGLCTGVERGSIASVEQLAQELKAFLDGRRLLSYRYSAWMLIRRHAQRYTWFWLMLLGALGLVTAGASTASARVRAERDGARLFARSFLDDVALRLLPRPGVEPLLEQVTTAALKHYQRTTDLQGAPREERLRVARAMARLGRISASLSRFDEARHSLDLAASLAGTGVSELALDGQTLVLQAQMALTQASFPELDSASAQEWIERARRAADQAVGLLPQSAEARRAAALARMQRAARQMSAPSTDADLDEAVKLLEGASSLSDEPGLRTELGAALVSRQAQRLARVRESGGKARLEEVEECRRVVEKLGQLRELSPDDLQLKAEAARGKLLLAEGLLEGMDVDGGTAEAQAAAQLARDILNRRPDQPAATELLRRAEALLAP